MFYSDAHYVERGLSGFLTGARLWYQGGNTNSMISGRVHRNGTPCALSHGRHTSCRVCNGE